MESLHFDLFKYDVENKDDFDELFQKVKTYIVEAD